MWPCNALFTFDYYSGSPSNSYDIDNAPSCTWLNDTFVHVFFPSYTVYQEQVIEVESIIRVVSGVIRSRCSEVHTTSQCMSYPTLNFSSTILTAPTYTEPVNVALYMPSIVSACSDTIQNTQSLQIDTLATTGIGYTTLYRVHAYHYNLYSITTV